MTRKKLTQKSLAGLLLTAFCVATTSTTNALPIDDFKTTQSIEASAATKVAASSVESEESLGRYRTLRIELRSGLSVLATIQPGHGLAFKGFPASEGNVSVIWDGDDNAKEIALDELGSVNFAAAKNNAFVLHIKNFPYEAKLAGSFKIALAAYTHAGDGYLAEATLNRSYRYGTLVIPFSAFKSSLPDTVARLNWKEIGALELILSAKSDYGFDCTISSIATCALDASGVCASEIASPTTTPSERADAARSTPQPTATTSTTAKASPTPDTVSKLNSATSTSAPRLGRAGAFPKLERKLPSITAAGQATGGTKTPPSPAVEKISQSNTEPQIVKQKIFVQYRDTLSATAPTIFKRRSTFRAQSRSLSDSIDRLNTQYRVKRVKYAFLNDDETAELEQSKPGTMISPSDFKDFIEKKSQRGRGLHSAGSSPIKTPDLSGFAIVEFDSTIDPRVVAAEYAKSPDVISAGTIQRAGVTEVPSDYYYSRSGSWGQEFNDLWNIDEIKAPQAWSSAKGSGQVVAVIDTGVDVAHIDLAANTVAGINIINPSLPPTDNHGHGTHVAGIIAAVGNTEGVVGIAPLAKIMPIKALGDDGFGTSENLALGIRWAADHGASVINNSWGCYSWCPKDQLTEAAVAYAIAQGSVVVFGAGNAADRVADYSPQNMSDPKPIIVGASNNSKEIASFSNYGLAIDLVAPGAGPELGSTTAEMAMVNNVLSLKSSTASDLMTKWCLSTEDCIDLTVGGKYLRSAGTSMAAPHVSAVAALIRSMPGRSALSHEEIRQILRSSAVDLGAPGTDAVFGAGLLDAAQALQIASPIKVKLIAPAGTNTTSVNLNGTVAGNSLDSYKIEYTRATTPANWTTIKQGNNTPISAGLLSIWNTAALTEGAYILRLSAKNTAGQTFTDLAMFSVDRSNARQLTTDPLPQTMPAIYGSKIAWTDARATTDFSENKRSDIRIFTLPSGPEVVIPNSGKEAALPSIHGNRVAWYRDLKASSPEPWLAQGEIMISHLPTLSTEVAVPAAYRSLWSNSTGSFSLVNDKLLWPGVIDSEWGRLWDIGLYDMTHKSSQQIGINSATFGLGESGFVFEDFINGFGTQVHYRRLVSSTPVWLNTMDENPSVRLSPQISGDWVTWVDHSYDGEKHLIDIGVFNIVTKEYKKITNDDATQESPMIEGHRVVWVDNRNGNSDIYGFDLRTNQEFVVTTHHETQTNPRISGNKVVWEDYRSGRGSNSDIYMRELPRSSPVIYSDPRSIKQGQELRFRVAEGDTVPLTYTGSALPSGATMIGDTFVWTPSSSQVGTHSIRFAASDGTETVTRTVQITVPGNNAPSFTNLPTTPLSWSTGHEHSVTFSITDVNAEDVEDGMLVTRVENPIGNMRTEKIDNSTWRFVWTPQNSDMGSKTVTLAVSDGSLSTVGTIGLNIIANRPPFFVGQYNSVEIKAGREFNLTISGDDLDLEDELSLTVSGLPGSPSIGWSSTRGNFPFNWTPSAEHVGTHQAVFSLSDGAVSVTLPIAITVHNRNTLPQVTFTNPGPYLFTVGRSKGIPLQVSDADIGDTVTCSVPNAPAGLTVDCTNITWTPSNAQVITRTFEATDGVGTTRVNIVLDAAVNTAPLVEPIPAKSVKLGGTFRFNVRATDAEGGPLTYRVTAVSSIKPANANIDATTGEFVWVPDSTQVGARSLRFAVSDERGFSNLGVTVSFTVKANNAPNLTQPSNRSVNEGETLRFKLEATDSNSSDVLTFGSSSALPTGATLDAAGNFEWTPSFTSAGTYPITFSVTDGTPLEPGAVVVKNMTITVVDRPSGPIAPSNLRTMQLFSRNVVLLWDDNSSDETGFEVQQAINPAGAWLNVGYPATNIFHRTVGGLTPEMTYYFRVRAVRQGVYSAYSSVLTIKTPPEPPVKPQNLTAQPVVFPTTFTWGITLNWKDMSNNESAFIIYARASASLPYVEIGRTRSDVTTWVHKLSPKGTWSYYVKAYNETSRLYSEMSNTATVTIPAGGPSPIPSPKPVVPVS